MKNDLRIVNLRTYTSPAVKEMRNKQWVASGEDNNYFQHIIDRYNGSPTNNACITASSEMIYGKGLEATDSNRKPDKYAQMFFWWYADCREIFAYDLNAIAKFPIPVSCAKDTTNVL